MFKSLDTFEHACSKVSMQALCLCSKQMLSISPDSQRFDVNIGRDLRRQRGSVRTVTIKGGEGFSASVQLLLHFFYIFTHFYNSIMSVMVTYTRVSFVS